jgi:hypothetical protein
MDGAHGRPLFSLWRAVRMLSMSLDVLVIAGSAVKLLLALGSSLQWVSRLAFDAAYNIVLLSAVLFILIQFGRFFGICDVACLGLREVFSMYYLPVGDCFLPLHDHARPSPLRTPAIQRRVRLRGISSAPRAESARQLIVISHRL